MLCRAYIVVLSFQLSLERLNETSCLYARLLEAFDDDGMNFGIAEGRKLTTPVVSTVETMQKRSPIGISIVGKVGRLVWNIWHREEKKYNPPASECQRTCQKKFRLFESAYGLLDFVIAQHELDATPRFIPLEFIDDRLEALQCATQGSRRRFQ